MVRKEGFSSLFKGMMAPLAALLPQSIITFSLYDYLSDNIYKTSKDTPDRIRNMFINGTIAGTISLLFFVPFEILKITQQNNRTVKESYSRIILNIWRL